MICDKIFVRDMYNFLYVLYYTYIRTLFLQMFSNISVICICYMRQVKLQIDSVPNSVVNHRSSKTNFTWSSAPKKRRKREWEVRHFHSLENVAFS